MKIRFHFSIVTLTFLLTQYLPPTYAQDYMHWSLPEGANARLGKGWISGGTVYSPDGSRLAVSSSVGIWIYDANNYTEVALLIGHTDKVNAVAFSPDGKTLVSGGADSTVLLWNIQTGEVLHTLENHNRGVDDVAFSPDGKMFGSIDGEEEIRIWDADTVELMHTLRSDSRWWGTVGSVNCLAFSADSKMVAGGYYHGRINFWDVNTGKFLYGTDFSVSWGVNSVAFSSDGVTLGMGSGSNGVYLVGAHTGQLWQRVGKHKDDVNSVAFSSDGNILASGGDDKRIQLWDTFTGEYIRTLEGHTSGVLSVSFSPGGDTITSASWTEIIFWNANTGQHLHSIEGHTRSVQTVALSPNGNILARGYEDGTVQLSDVTTGGHKQTLTGHTNLVRSVAFSPDGKTLASGSFDDTIRLWDTASGEYKQTLMEHRDPVQTVVFSPNGETLASGSQDGTIRLWDTTTGKNKQTIRVGSNWVYSLDFAPDGQTFVSASAGKFSGHIYLWHARSERRLRTYVSKTNTYAAAFSPDGSIIAGGVDNEIWLWNSRSGEVLQKFTEHTDRILSVSFSPDGEILATGGSDRTIQLWDVDAGTNLQILKAHTDSVYDLEFSPDGNTLVSGSADGTVLLWTFTPADMTDDTPSKPTTSLSEDVNMDGVVNILDLVLVSKNFGQTGENSADINEDGVVNIVDLVLIAGAIGNSPDSPAVGGHDIESIPTRTDVQQWLTQAQRLELTDATQRGVNFLQHLLVSLNPKVTALLPNYPNPFNPETWIPYQLATPADVIISIYSADGQLVRKLDLGHQEVGIYESLSQAAHWDGKNGLGEHVASGVYFYRLIAGNYSNVRKMLIRK